MVVQLPLSFGHPLQKAHENGFSVYKETGKSAASTLWKTLWKAQMEAAGADGSAAAAEMVQHLRTQYIVDNKNFNRYSRQFVENCQHFVTKFLYFTFAQISRLGISALFAGRSFSRNPLFRGEYLASQQPGPGTLAYWSR
jgi:hypothetical protein